MLGPSSKLQNFAVLNDLVGWFFFFSYRQYEFCKRRAFRVKGYHPKGWVKILTTNSEGAYAARLKRLGGAVIRCLTKGICSFAEVGNKIRTFAIGVTVI